MHIILKPASLFIKIKPDYPVTCFSLVMRPCHFRMQRSTSFVWASENLWASQVALMVKEPICQCKKHKRCRLIPGSWRSPGRGMATRSSILAWRIPWTEEPGELQSVGLRRLRNNWSDLARTHADNHYWCGYSKMYLALCLLMTPWVVSDCSISATMTNTPLGRALCTWSISPGRDVDSLLWTVWALHFAQALPDQVLQTQQTPFSPTAEKVFVPLNCCQELKLYKSDE